ncbi:MAG: Helix-turn-helix domain protein [Candidatus Omnitrophica bacterium ADurb.Bin292]|nr:MAG: Helix-turn-helix domain protein [Candidatus Omnitrophica bacterium ADurb.Bin292]
MNDIVLEKHDSPGDRLLSIEDISGMLGVRKSTLYSWSHQRRIPYIKVGSLLRFRLRDIEKWLKQQTVDVYGQL